MVRFRHADRAGHPGHQIQSAGGQGGAWGTSVLEIVLDSIDKELAGEEVPKEVKRLEESILQSPAPDSIRLNNEQTGGPSGPETVEQPGLGPKRRIEFPVIRSARPGSLVIDNETIYDLIDFP